jgi:membrane-bound ClpP family serine protease
MTLVILLFSLGIALLVIEVIIPGGIIGGIGALFMFGGCVMSFVEFGTTGGMIAVGAALGLTILAFYIELAVLPKTRVGRRAFLDTQINAKSSTFAEDARSLVGMPAEAATRLSPGGYVRIDGRRYEAFCQTGQVPAGAALTVVGTDNFRLIVTPANNP